MGKEKGGSGVEGEGSRVTFADRLIDVLGCELDVRPTGAPGPADIAHALLDVKREATGVLVLSFDPSAARTVDAFVAAEQRCCAGLGWSVETSEVTRVRVVAAPPQLDALEQLFTQAN